MGGSVTYPMSKLIGCSIETDNKISGALSTATVFFTYVVAFRTALVVMLPKTDAVGDTRTVAFALWITLTFAFGARLSG